MFNQHVEFYIIKYYTSFFYHERTCSGPDRTDLGNEDQEILIEDLVLVFNHVNGVIMPLNGLISQ